MKTLSVFFSSADLKTVLVCREEKRYWRPTSFEKKTHLLHKISPNKKHATTAKKSFTNNVYLDTHDTLETIKNVRTQMPDENRFRFKL